MKDMDKIEENKLFELYTLAELAYQKHFFNMTNNKKDFFPEGWYEKKNYRLKIEIIKEAIKNNMLIENTSKYLESIEGVVNVLKKN